MQLQKCAIEDVNKLALLKEQLWEAIKGLLVLV